MNAQLDMLDLFEPKIEITATTRFKAPTALGIDERGIDAALHHVENQSVLRRLKNGEKWSEAMGLGGSSNPVSWQSCAKGIEIGYTPDKRLIPLSEIMKRVGQYKPQP